MSNPLHQKDPKAQERPPIPLPDPDQVRHKLERYATLGIDAFILSGYPHVQECDRFGRLVLPGLEHAPLAFA